MVAHELQIFYMSEGQTVEGNRASKQEREKEAERDKEERNRERKGGVGAREK